jgi:hypothetical protein
VIHLPNPLCFEEEEEEEGVEGFYAIQYDNAF